MNKTIIVLYSLLFFSTVNAGKVSILSQEVTEKSEETIENNSSIQNNDDEDESASIEIANKDVVNNKNDDFFKDEPNDVERNSQVPTDTNLTRANAKLDDSFQDLISDSNSDTMFENHDDRIEEILPSITSVENNNRQEAIEIVIEDITESYNHEESKDENSSMRNEDENNWRSAENIQSDHKEYSNEGANEEFSLEDDDRTYNVEDFMDKKIGQKFKNHVETRKPDRMEHLNIRPINTRQYYRPPEDHSILDLSPRRSFSDIVFPRLRPMLTRNGIMFTPTMYTMQKSSPLLEQVAGQHWIPNRHHNVHSEEEHFTRPTRPHNRIPIIPGLPRYENPKMIDDYNDYGSNTYSYAPSIKLTTLAPPQQIIAPNKFDILQKLVEASNQPNKLLQRTFNDNLFPGNFYPQRQFPESYGFDVRRMRRDVWDEEPFQDI